MTRPHSKPCSDCYSAVETKGATPVRSTFAVLITLVAVSLAAQPLTVGTQIVDNGGTATITTGGPVTYVNLSAGATAAGTVNKATVAWSASCSNAFRIVFLRETFNSVAAFTLVA